MEIEGAPAARSSEVVFGEAVGDGCNVGCSAGVDAGAEGETDASGVALASGSDVAAATTASDGDDCGVAALEHALKVHDARAIEAIDAARKNLEEIKSCLDS